MTGAATYHLRRSCSAIGGSHRAHRAVVGRSALRGRGDDKQSGDAAPVVAEHNGEPRAVRTHEPNRYVAMKESATYACHRLLIDGQAIQPERYKFHLPI